MRRFGDFLRIIASTMLGLSVREIDTMMKNLATYFSKHSTASFEDAYPIAWATGIVVIVLFLRNLHGSACYDDYLSRHPKYVPSFERRTLGRVVAFFLTVCGLFLGPALAAHTLEHHMDGNTSVFAFAFVLFSSLIAYALFDLMLWLDPSREPASIPMRDIATRWLRTDAVGLILPMLLLPLYNIFLRASGRILLPQDVALIFVVCTLLMICVDYWSNATFYFPCRDETTAPSVREDAARPGGCDEAAETASTT
jgi:hypothetical protein